MLILVVYISAKAMSCKTLLKYSNKSKVQHMLQTEIFIFFFLSLNIVYSIKQLF